MIIAALIIPTTSEGRRIWIRFLKLNVTSTAVKPPKIKKSRISKVRPENRHTSIAPINVVQAAEVLSFCKRIRRKGRKAKGTTIIGRGVNKRHAFKMKMVTINDARSKWLGGFFC